MEKTLDTIEMDFQNAARQASELEQVAQNLHMLAEDDIQACLSAVSANWKGENAAAFCKKGAVVGNHIKNSAENLKNAAEVLREIARNIYDAEKKNYEIARNRD